MGAGASALADSSSEINTFLKSQVKKNPNGITSSEWLFNACWFNNIAEAKTNKDIRNNRKVVLNSTIKSFL